jgi:hypothetical protein
LGWVAERRKQARRVKPVVSKKGIKSVAGPKVLDVFDMKSFDRMLRGRLVF